MTMGRVTLVAGEGASVGIGSRSLITLTPGLARRLARQMTPQRLGSAAIRLDREDGPGRSGCRQAAARLENNPQRSGKLLKAVFVVRTERGRALLVEQLRDADDLPRAA